MAKPLTRMQKIKVQIKQVMKLKGHVPAEVYKHAIEKTLEVAQSCNMQAAASDLVKILNGLEAQA